MKIAILIANAYGMGGTIRTVFNIAAGLAERHDVEIVSLARHRETPFFTLPDGVRLVPLVNRGAGPDRIEERRLIDRWRERRYGGVVPLTEARRNQVFDGHTSHRVRGYLRSTDADVVMGTRPGINLLLARWAPSRLLTIGQEHVHLDNHAADVRWAIRRRYPRLDGMTVLTHADRRSYLDYLGGPPEWVTTIPNSLAPGDYPRSTQENPIIAAAGRMSPVKQYPKLLRAFAVLARKHPEWRLRIYGGGSRDEKLRKLVTKLGLSNQVALMGRSSDLTGELAKASLLAVSSRAEGFGMTIIEAFSVGVPVVSFDCPHGPREIIDSGRNGVLVPAQDVDALGRALLRLAESHEERERMGEEAVRASAGYDLSLVTGLWEEFIEQRMAARTGSGRRGSRAA